MALTYGPRAWIQSLPSQVSMIEVSLVGPTLAVVSRRTAHRRTDPLLRAA